MKSKSPSIKFSGISQLQKLSILWLNDSTSSTGVFISMYDVPNPSTFMNGIIVDPNSEVQSRLRKAETRYTTQTFHNSQQDTQLSTTHKIHNFPQLSLDQVVRGLNPPHNACYNTTSCEVKCDPPSGSCHLLNSAHYSQNNVRSITRRLLSQSKRRTNTLTIVWVFLPYNRMRVQF